jgi:hypothetical protein
VNFGAQIAKVAGQDGGCRVATVNDKHGGIFESEHGGYQLRGSPARCVERGKALSPNDSPQSGSKLTISRSAPVDQTIKPGKRHQASTQCGIGRNAGRVGLFLKFEHEGADFPAICILRDRQKCRSLSNRNGPTVLLDRTYLL